MTALSADSSPAERRRRRELIRAHHPDRGGDPAVLIEVLRNLDESSAGFRFPPDVRFASRRRRWRGLGLWRPFPSRRPKRVV